MRHRMCSCYQMSVLQMQLLLFLLCHLCQLLRHSQQVPQRRARQCTWPRLQVQHCTIEDRQMHPFVSAEAAGLPLETLWARIICQAKASLTLKTTLRVIQRLPTLTLSTPFMLLTKTRAKTNKKKCIAQVHSSALESKCWVP